LEVVFDHVLGGISKVTFERRAGLFRPFLLSTRSASQFGYEHSDY
jgi:hypothetical protein